MLLMIVGGNLGKDCIVNNVNGKNVINFNVAHSYSYRDNQGNKIQKTVWVQCAYWTESTNIAPYLKKGQPVICHGEPSADWYNANSNNANGISAYLKLTVRSLELTGKNPNSAPQQQGQQQQSNNAGGGWSNQGGTNGNDYPNPDDIKEPLDDLPF